MFIVFGSIFKEYSLWLYEAYWIYVLLSILPVHLSFIILPFHAKHVLNIIDISSDFIEPDKGWEISREIQTS